MKITGSKQSKKVTVANLHCFLVDYLTNPANPFRVYVVADGTDSTFYKMSARGCLRKTERNYRGAWTNGAIIATDAREQR